MVFAYFLQGHICATLLFNIELCLSPAKQVALKDVNWEEMCVKEAYQHRFHNIIHNSICGWNVHLQKTKAICTIYYFCIYISSFSTACLP